MARKKSDPPFEAPPPERREVCPYDGARLLASGMCPAAGGYPLGLNYGTLEAPVLCPFTCPICRHELAWSGACFTCYGQQHQGDPKCFPGDRYELYDDEGKPLGDGRHWTLVERGPIKAATPQQNKAAHLIRNRVSTGDLTVAQAHEELGRIFRPAGQR